MRTPPRLTRLQRVILFLLTLGLVVSSDAVAQRKVRLKGPVSFVFDLAHPQPSSSVTRASGFHAGGGVAGVPVSGGFDVDGDHVNDFAVGYFLSSPLGRFEAGEVDLVFGSGQIGESIDLAVPQARVLRIFGAGNNGSRETCGNEVWMGDVTGDGLGDLLICRQNFGLPTGFAVPTFRDGAGALTILVGSPLLRTLANSGADLDLANPPAGITLFTLAGAAAFDRLGIWARVGDVDGDGVSDIAVAADQSNAIATHGGEVFVVAGGSHLAQNATVDLANFGSTILTGKIARVRPGSGSSEFHLGSTLQWGDLDGNGRAELLLSSALNRAGASFGPFGSSEGFGGAPGGRAFVVWDDNFPSRPWPSAYSVDLANAPGSLTTILGGVNNISLGEELLGGLDYDGDGRAEFFVGDLVGDGTGGARPFSGLGYVFFRAERLKGQSFDVDNAPRPGLLTTILGPSACAIGADTVAQGDFDRDGFGDLAFGCPRAQPRNRLEAGTIDVFFGQSGRWPRRLDTLPGELPPAWIVRIAEIRGAHGHASGDTGDTLCYSATSGDMDGDGLDDLIVNEMTGNAVASGVFDVGNLLLLSGSAISPPRVP